MLGSAPAGFAHKTHRMAVVHHHQGVVLVRQAAHALQVADNAIHGEHPVSGDELDTGSGLIRRLQLGLQVLHIVVLIAVALGFAQAHAIDDRGMVQLVADHGVLRGKQGLKQPPIGVKAGGIENGVVRAQKAGDFLLQGLMDVLGAADEPHGGQAIALFVIGLLGGLNEPGAVAQAQVVVGAHAQQLPAILHFYPGPLGRDEGGLSLKQPGLPDGLHLFGVNL